MKNLFFTLLFSGALFSVSNAQLPNGTVAPNFTATDINGVQHNLYDLLNQGKTVYLEFSATWCGICWNYKNTHALKDLWNTYGPPGTNEAYVLFIESYQPSNTNCLYGSSGCNSSTQGNWVAGEPFPIIDDFTIGDTYDVSFYPIIYCVCPSDKKLYQTGTQNVAGLWNVRATNCTSALQVTTANVQNVSCFGTSTGNIDITPAGGASPYTYNWSNGAITQDLNNIPAGTYTCTVTSANGSTAVTNAIAVAGPASPLGIAQTNSTPMACNGTGATITVSASGGWSPYNYMWNNGQTGPTATGLNPGNYTVTVTDNNGCTKFLSAVVSAPSLPTAIIATPNQITCIQNSIQLSGTGSSSGAGISYLWTASNGGNITGSTSTISTTCNATGMYTLRVTNNATACSNTAMVNVTANTTSPTAVATSPGIFNCNVTIMQISGIGSSQGNMFTYQWTTANGLIVSGGTTLSPTISTCGLYKIEVTNTLNGCTATATVNVGKSPLVTAAITSQSNVSCNGGTNGMAFSTAGGGAGGFSYLWSNGSTAATATGLASGTYLLTVTDSENCTATASVTISQPAALSVNGTSTGQTGVGMNNGTASAAPGGGTPAYSYAWSNGAGTASITGLAPGNYTVTVTDNNACTAVQTLVVNAFNCAITAQAVAVNVSCAGAANGSVSLTLNGGSGNITYIWNNGATTASISGLAAGTYTATISDGSGCTTLAGASVTQPAVLFANGTATAQTAVGVNNGTAAAMPSGGTPAYNYQWSTGATTASISGLAPGNYTVTVTDAHGCTAIQTMVVNVYNCAILAQTNIVNVACANTATGAVSVSMTGGTSPFNYNWSNGATTSALTGLAAGIYTATITDGAGCSTLATAIVTQPAAIAVNGTATPLTAVGANDGTATAAPSGGVPGYIYFWSNGTSTAVISGLATGNYTVTVTDLNGCTATQTVVVNPFNCTIAAQPVVTSASCAGMANGSVTLNLNGGTSPFTYLWSNGETTQSIVNQLPGNYFVTVSDDNGCQIISAITIGVTDQTPPVINCPGSIRACPNTNVVQFQIPVATDNCGTAGLQVIQTTGLASGAFFPLGTTIQTFVATDGGGNTAQCSFEVIVSPPVVFENEVVTPATNGQNNGAISLTVSGGNAPYQYYWTNSAGQLVGTGAELTNLAAGFYVLKLTDLYGCEFYYAVEVKSATGQSEPTWMSGLQILPNPATDVAQVIFNEIPSGEIQLTLADATGRVCQRKIISGTTATIECAGLPAGIYSVIFQSEYGGGFRKLVVVGF